MTYTFTVTEEYEGKKLFAYLRAFAGISSSLIKSVKYDEDGLAVNGERAKTDYAVRAGDRVTVSAGREENSLSPCYTPVPIAYESEDIIVFDKPAGMAVHPTLNYPDGTLANVYAGLLASRGEVGAIHLTNRLDKNTSGLVLAGKNRLVTPLLAKSADKEYLAVVEGIVEENEGIIDRPIAFEGDSIIKRRTADEGLSAVTEYRVIERFSNHTLVRVHMLTGRTHQIRVHFSSVGHPLAGDDLYGGGTKLISRHALHCARLLFTRPFSGERVVLESPLPEDMSALIGSGLL